jgi:hypothetical protein
MSGVMGMQEALAKVPFSKNPSAEPTMIVWVGVGWLFGFQSKRYMETRSPLDRLLGGYFLVLESGEVVGLNGKHRWQDSVVDWAENNGLRTRVENWVVEQRDMLSGEQARPPQAISEARAWIAGSGTFGGDGFVNTHNASAFVEELYAAGATLVEVHADSLVATLPRDAAARARVIAIYNREVDTFGEEFGGEELKGHEITREEAIAMGHPEAEGEWCVDDLHVTDSGQTTIKFWWD